MNKEQIAEARAWIAECLWADMDEESIADLTDAQVLRGITRHYSGGITQFLADGVAIG